MSPEEQEAGAEACHAHCVLTGELRSADCLLETQGSHGGILRQGIRFGFLEDHSDNRG